MRDSLLNPQVLINTNDAACDLPCKDRTHPDSVRPVGETKGVPAEGTVVIKQFRVALSKLKIILAYCKLKLEFIYRTRTT